TRIGLRDEIDRLRRPANEDDLLRRARVDESPYPLAGTLEGFRGCLAESMDTPMYVGMGVRFIVLNGAQHRDRSLRRGPAVEIHERPAIYGPIQNREVAPDALDIQHRTLHDLRCGSSHQINSCNAAVSFNWPARLSSICRRSSGT